MVAGERLLVGAIERRPSLEGELVHVHVRGPQASLSARSSRVVPYRA
jgi:hypothetical protein